MHAMQHLKWIEVDLAAIRSNLRRVLSRLNPGVRLMAVVKADAYGHGMSAARELEKAGAASLGVLNIAEAANLRKAGVKIPIQLLSPILPENARDVVRLGLIPTLDDLKQAGALNKAAGGRKIPVHLDLDYGFWGLGVAPQKPEGLSPGLRGPRKIA